MNRLSNISFRALNEDQSIHEDMDRVLALVKPGLFSLADKVIAYDKESAYSSILIDDCSGRIPGLFVWRALKAVNGRTLPAFAARIDHSKSVDLELGNNVLIVSEQLARGRRAKILMSEYESLGRDFSVAVCTTLCDPSRYRFLGAKNLIIADCSSQKSAELLHGDRELSGVSVLFKEVGYSVVPHGALYDPIKEKVTGYDSSIQRGIAHGRSRLREIVNEYLALKI